MGRNPRFFQKFSLGASQLVFSLQRGTACCLFLIASIVRLECISPHKKIITINVPDQDLTHKVVQTWWYRFSPYQIAVCQSSVYPVSVPNLHDLHLTKFVNQIILQLHKNRYPNEYLLFWYAERDSFAFSPTVVGENRCSPPASRRRQQSTGLLHLFVRALSYIKSNNSTYPFGEVLNVGIYVRKNIESS